MLPEYVLPYKKKGYKIKEKNSHYYLYKVTSIRIPGYKYPQEKDIYLGVILPSGLKKPKKVASTISTYDYGICMYLLNITNTYFNDYSIEVKIKAVLSLMFGVHIFDFHFRSTYLSIIYPNIKITPLKQVEKELSNKILYKINNDDYSILFNIRAIKIDDKWTLSNLSEKNLEILNKYNIKTEL